MNRYNGSAGRIEGKTIELRVEQVNAVLADPPGQVPLYGLPGVNAVL